VSVFFIAIVYEEKKENNDHLPDCYVTGHDKDLRITHDRFSAQKSLEMNSKNNNKKTPIK
jgi:hypothetical protein